MHPLSLLMSTNLVIPFHVIPSKNWFRSAIQAISGLYTRFISVSEIKSYYYDNKDFNNCCHICFDDGDRTVYENAFPILQGLHIPATLFVSPKIIREGINYWFQDVDRLAAHLGDEPVKKAVCRIMRWDFRKIRRYSIFSIFTCLALKDIFRIIDCIEKEYGILIDERYNLSQGQIEELNSSGLITIGAHTMNHPILSNESDEEAEAEITESVRALSSMLSKEVECFAYPNGISGLDYKEREQALLRNNGIKLAFTMDRGFFSKATDPLKIPRDGYPRLKGERKSHTLSRILFLPIRNVIEPVRGERVERINLKRIVSCAA